MFPQPLARTDPPLNPLRAFAPYAEAPGSVLLFSGGAHAGEANYFWARAPRATLTASAGELFLQQGKKRETLGPFSTARLDKILTAQGVWKNAEIVALGYFGYELGRHWLVAPPGKPAFHSQALGELPDLWLGFYDEVESGSFSPPETKPTAVPDALVLGEIQRFSDCTCEVFQRKVERILAWIRAGDLYQANLAQCFQLPWNPARSTFALFEQLCRQNPAPFSAFLQLGEGRTILSCSPERFLRLRGQTLTAQPIKGTSARHGDPAEDSHRREELLASAKNRAELTMIVDLLRNDLGRVCVPGSIHVPELAALHSFATVHHLIGTIEGKVPAELTPGELLAATFPGGSVTGAPKGRAAQVIAELEGGPRGAYCGAIGYLSGAGVSARALDWNVAIRTLQIDGNRATLHAGAGIVAESEPLAEYEETLAKVAPILAAVLHP